MLKIFKLDNPKGIEKYKSLLSSLDNVEPYCLTDYIDIFSGGMDNLICFSFTTSTNGFIIIPGYLKQIDIGDQENKYFDSISPYGYSGPYFSAVIKGSDIHDFWKQVDQWDMDNNVDTDVIRFNLLVNNLNEYG
mgnify:CR=1 FL=1